LVYYLPVMIPFILRLLWRLIILLLGAAALSFLVLTFWPEAGSRDTIFIALLIIYCLMAYIVVPALMRLFHIFSKPDHIPIYAATRDGWPSDPINITVIAKSERHLIRSFNKAGWHTSDPLTFKNGLRELMAIIFNTSYPEAPLSNLYLFDRPQDVAFAIPTSSTGSPRTRHHVRFWRLEKPITESRHSSHYEFWRRKVRHILKLEKEIWIGAATEDIRMIDIQWRTGQITHGVSHDAQKEREFIIKTLRDKKLVKSIDFSEAGEQFKFRGQSFRTIYTTDSSIKIVRLSSPIKSIPKAKLKKS